MAPVVEFRVLGPVEAVVDGQPVPLPAGKPRALLVALLLTRNRVVPVHQLIDELWGDEPPDTAAKALQVYVSQLRKAIGADRVLTKTPGYSLRVEEGELDLDVFEREVREGRELLAAGDAEAASQRFEDALALWRGPAPAQLEESRLAALEDRIEADLVLGRHARLISELEELVARYPLRERLRGQLMLALYRSGRQAEALDLYRRTRETLIDELGIEPSPELQELERAILQQDKSLEVGRRPVPVMEGAPPPPGARRRPVLVLGVVLLLATIAAGATAFALSSGGSSGNGDAELRTFVTKVENFLVQSRDGRRQIATAIGNVFTCKLTVRAGVAELNQVQRNRQSLLQQIAALSVPNSAQALLASDLLQKAAQASITADWRYRDLLLRRARCGTPSAKELRPARAADAKATRAKQAFLATFDPLARRFGQRAWNAGEF